MTRTSNDTIITLEGFAHAETGKAVQFEIYKIGDEHMGAPKKEWFPFSQVKRIVRQPKNSQEMDTLVVSEWIMKAKELI